MLFLGAVAYDPFQFLYESGAVYAYGTAVPEDHDTTRETLGAWLYAFCAGMDWGWTRRDCVALRDATFEKMFFTNVFARELGAAIGICLDAELKSCRAGVGRGQRFGSSHLLSACSGNSTGPRGFCQCRSAGAYETK